MAQDPASQELIPIGAGLTGPHWPGPVRVVRVEPRGSDHVLAEAVTLMIQEVQASQITSRM